MRELLPNLGALITAGLGLMGLVRPSAAAALTSIQPVGLVGVSEIRATYGGFFLALGACALVMQTPAVFSVVGIAWLGTAFGRTVSVFVDGSRSPQNVGAIAFEAAIGALLVVQA